MSSQRVYRMYGKRSTSSTASAFDAFPDDAIDAEPSSDTTHGLMMSDTSRSSDTKDRAHAAEEMDEGRAFAAPASDSRNVNSRPKQVDLRSFMIINRPNASSSSSFTSRNKVKREPLHNVDASISNVASASSSSAPLSMEAPRKARKLEQLHLVPVRKNLASSDSASRSANGLYTTCQRCGMSYIRGGLGGDDELVHVKHCDRVVNGVVWVDVGSGAGGGRSSMEQKAKDAQQQDKWGTVLREDVRFGAACVGKIVCVEGRQAGKNAKLREILDSVDLVLSSPALPPEMLDKCKIYLFVTSSPPQVTSVVSTTSSSSKSGPSVRARKGHQQRKQQPHVVSCVVAQPIKRAMEIVRPGETESNDDDGTDLESARSSKRQRRRETVIVDSGNGDPTDEKGGSVVCWPERLPTKLGIHRLFTAPEYRRCGLSKVLLDEACRNTIYGYTCRPEHGDVAFSQPTRSGKAVMDHWGKGKVRVFVEDEQE